MAGQLRSRRRGLVTLSTVAGLLLVGLLAPLPWLATHWSRVLAVGLFLFLFVFVAPRLFVPARGRLEDERLKLQNDVRIGLLQAVAGVAVVAAVVATWQQLDTDRRQLRQQLEAAGRQQAGDRFAQALGQLGSQQLYVRLGGIYGLERIAASSAPQDRVQVFEVLSAYVRTTSRRPPVGPAVGSTLQVRQPDVHAAVTVLARRTVLDGDPPLDLSGSVLPGARLGWARLGWAQLAGADLRGADVRGTSLQHAGLAGVHLEQSLLCGTEFQDADLRGVHLAGARVSADTRWPAGFDWKAAGARLVATC
jgi:hypothetical protein